MVPQIVKVNPIGAEYLALDIPKPLMSPERHMRIVTHCPQKCMVWAPANRFSTYSTLIRLREYFFTFCKVAFSDKMMHYIQHTRKGFYRHAVVRDISDYLC